MHAQATSVRLEIKFVLKIKLGKFINFLVIFFVMKQTKKPCSCSVLL